MIQWRLILLTSRKGVALWWFAGQGSWRLGVLWLVRGLCFPFTTMGVMFSILHRGHFHSLWRRVMSPQGHILQTLIRGDIAPIVSLHCFLFFFHVVSLSALSSPLSLYLYTCVYFCITVLQSGCVSRCYLRRVHCVTRRSSLSAPWRFTPARQVLFVLVFSRVHVRSGGRTCSFVIVGSEEENHKNTRNWPLC